MIFEAAQPLSAKLQFLSSATAYGGPRAGPVAVKETHMSFVFLTKDRVYKLKKPLSRPPLDLTTLPARKKNCEEEVRLNRRLAPGLYVGVVPLTAAAEGRLALGGEGEIIDWLVAMRRLPAELMLDRLLEVDGLSPLQVDALADLLAIFYRSAAKPKVTPDSYVAHLCAEHRANLEILRRPFADFDSDAAREIGARVDKSLVELAPLLRKRADALVDGHGDLRPEHICLTQPIVIFDCLEFSATLRTIDPFDELSYLALECSMPARRHRTSERKACDALFVEAADFGPLLIERVAARLGERPRKSLLLLYTALRAELRARLVLTHLLDAHPREADKWPPLAASYLAIARESLDRLQSETSAPQVLA